MSDPDEAYKELVKRLRAVRCGPVHVEAADALEALAGEVERLQSLVVETSAKAGAAIGSCEVLADAIARKDEDVAEVTAERDRLKAALEEIVQHEVSREQFIMQGPAFAARMVSRVIEIARKALEEAA